MYAVFSIAEKGLRGIKAGSKLLYYKAKYGRRLKVGKGVRFRKGFMINISKNGRVEIGDGTWFNNYCSINCHDKIIIGKDNLFGEGVRIYDHNHVFNNKSVNMKKTFKSRPIMIGDKNWFGSNVVIISGAKVGNCNVFGAGAVVNSEYGSDNLVKVDNKTRVEKIRYKVTGDD